MPLLDDLHAATFNKPSGRPASRLHQRLPINGIDRSRSFARTNRGVGRSLSKQIKNGSFQRLVLAADFSRAACV